MNVFKYRNGNENDIDALFQDYFYSPLAEELNDPFETFVDSESYKKEIDKLIKRKNKQNSYDVISNRNNLIATLGNLLDRLDRNVGYYSLSKNKLNETMWALYANSHKGFCIEYDLDELLKPEERSKYRYRIDVQYQDKPSIINTADFDRIKKDKGKSIISKKGGCKSKAWAHEEEIRIITDKIGRNNYQASALKAIYFGIRMSKEQKDLILNHFEGSNVQIYQMELIKDTYKLTYRTY
ncbi:MAG TPA: DUF2971 domain-containing protein [Vicingaceae bacterium]